MFNRLIKLFFSSITYYCGLCHLARLINGNDKVLVLMYHRVLKEEEIKLDIHPGMYVSNHSFEKQLGYLIKKYQIISLNDFEEWISGDKKFNRPPCMITFDDGWKDNYTNAYPLLNKFNVSATIFLATKFIGQEDMLTWENVKEMESSRITFASHTISHKNLDSISYKELQEELIGSRNIIDDELDKNVKWLCYPKGIYNNAVIDSAEKYYLGAFTTHNGLVSKHDHKFTLKRVGIHDDISKNIPLFAYRISFHN